MIKLIKNFIKADLRQKNLVFWDWVVPLVLMGGVTMFLKGKDYASFMFPSLICYLMLQNLIFALPFRMSQYKTDGIINLLSEEGKTNKFMVAFLISRAFIILIQCALFIPFGIFIIKPETNISVIGISIAYILGVFSVGGLALLIGCITKTENGALGLSQLFYFGLTAISGIFYPLDKSPKILQVLSNISPVKYLNECWHYSLIGGNKPISAIIALIVFGLICVVLILISNKGILNKTKTKQAVRSYEKEYNT